MSNTIRRNKHDKKYSEGQDSIKNPYICRCPYCSRVEKQALQEKIADREMLRDLKEVA